MITSVLDWQRAKKDDSRSAIQKNLTQGVKHISISRTHL